MAETPLHVERIPPIARLTLRNPARRNALSVEMMRALLDALTELADDPEIAVLILAAEGPAFSAGHDLREMTCGGDLEDYRRIFDLCTELMTKLQAIPQPVIAEVDGVAAAAGCQLVAACDLAVASTDSKFATPGVKIGLFCSTPMVALSRAIGRKRALEMLLTGRVIDAETAAEWGLVNRAVPPAALRETVDALAAEIARSSRMTVGLGKQAFYAQIDLDQPKAYAYTKEVMSKNALAADAQEGMTAFLEKREPKWQGR